MKQIVSMPLHHFHSLSFSSPTFRSPWESCTPEARVVFILGFTSILLIPIATGAAHALSYLCRDLWNRQYIVMSEKLFVFPISPLMRRRHPHCLRMIKPSPYTIAKYLPIGMTNTPTGAQRCPFQMVTLTTYKPFNSYSVECPPQDAFPMGRFVIFL